MSLMSLSRLTFCTACLSLLSSAYGTALADNYNSARSTAQAPEMGETGDWAVTLGGGALMVPEYQGSDEYEFMAVPYVDVKYKDIVTFNPFEGLRYNAFREGGLTLGAGVGYDFGRDDDDGDRLRGMGDVDGSVEGQLFAKYGVGATSGEITFAHDLGDGHEGYTVEAEVGHAFFISEARAIIRPSIGTTYASDNYMESYFGVSNAQANTSRAGLNQFDAGAGFKDVSANVFARLPLTQHWSLNGLAGYSRLLGDAADSPVTESENQFMTGAFVAYTF